MSETLPHSRWLWPIHSGCRQEVCNFCTLNKPFELVLFWKVHFTFPFAAIEGASSCIFFWFDLRFTLGHWLYIKMMEASDFKKKANDKITKNLHSSVYSQSMVWSSKIIILTPRTEGQLFDSWAVSSLCRPPGRANQVKKPVVSSA